MSVSDDPHTDIAEYRYSYEINGLIYASASGNIDLLDYTADKHGNVDEDFINQDDFSLLFTNSSFPVCPATLCDMQFAASTGFDRIRIIKLLKLIDHHYLNPIFYQ